MKPFGKLEICWRATQAAAVASAQVTAAEIQAESRAVEQTMGALKNLVNEPAVDLRLQFERFSSALDELLAAAKRTEASGKRMAEKSAAYFAAWTSD
jgi:hypothetical protein